MGRIELAKTASISHGPDTPITKALSHACYVITGEVGEAVLDPDGYRAGTALDEVLHSQRIAYALALRVKMDERISGSRYASGLVRLSPTTQQWGKSSYPGLIGPKRFSDAR